MNDDFKPYAIMAGIAVIVCASLIIFTLASQFFRWAFAGQTGVPKMPNPSPPPYNDYAYWRNKFRAAYEKNDVQAMEEANYEMMQIEKCVGVMNKVDIVERAMQIAE